ncbi:MAG: HEAT repeat domain-containing protein [Planctomycetes bacterium]|nr:HEAT repeat domain-containing protein [Planctomycetota bacterium]
MTASDLDWVFWSLGGLLGVIGISLAAWALLWDRARGRRRCAKCWYNMSGSPGRVCSECGYRAKREKKLFKTRRHWRWVFVGILVLAVGYGASVTPRVKRSWVGWPGAVPTVVLIAMFPWLKPNGVLSYELSTRAIRDEMWGWQLSWLVGRYAGIIEGNQDAATRTGAVQMLALIGPEAHASLPALLRGVNDSSADVRGAVAGAIGRIRADSQSSVPRLIVLLRDNDANVRTMAADGLWLFGAEAEAGIPALMNALTDESEQVRLASAVALSRIAPDPQVAMPLLIRTLQSRNRHLRIRAIVALVKLGPHIDGVLPALVSALGDADSRIRVMVIGSLAKMGADASPAVPALIEIVQDEDADWRDWAAYALGAIGPEAEAAIPALKELLDDEDEYRREVVTGALEKIRRVSDD